MEHERNARPILRFVCLLVPVHVYQPIPRYRTDLFFIFIFVVFCRIHFFTVCLSFSLPSPSFCALCFNFLLLLLLCISAFLHAFHFETSSNEWKKENKKKKKKEKAHKLNERNIIISNCESKWNILFSSTDVSVVERWILLQNFTPLNIQQPIHTHTRTTHRAHSRVRKCTSLPYKVIAGTQFHRTETDEE